MLHAQRLSFFGSPRCSRLASLNCDLGMERSRESKRAASAPRRLRISCPKDPADAEARMDETPLIEKVKKGNLQAFSASFSATATAWGKRKRNGFLEAHNLFEGTDFGKDLPELTPSEEYEDEARPGAVNSKQRAKKDELVMNISNIPRRARSTATRVSFASMHQPVATSQQRSPSPKILAAKEEKTKPVGMKSRLLKDLGVMESSQISDQEVEVAEVLFDLSRSMPSCIQSTSAKCEEKSRNGLEEEEFNSSSSHIAGIGNMQKSPRPISDERKSKRQRAFCKQEEALCMPSSERVNASAGCFVNGVPLEGIQVDESQCKHGISSKLFCEQPELMTRDIVKEPRHAYSLLHVADPKNTNYVEERGQEPRASERNLTHLAEQISNQDNLALSSLAVNKSELCGQVIGKGDNCSKISSRREPSEASGMSSKQDIWCPPSKVSSEVEINIDEKRLSLSESSSNLASNYSGNVSFANNEMVNQGDKVRRAIVKDESRSGSKDVQQGNQERSKDTLYPVKEEQMDSRLLDVKKEDTVKSDKGQEAFSGVFSSPSTVHPSSSSATTFMGWMDTFPQSGKTGSPWLTNCSHLASSSYQVVQLPHAASARRSAQRMKRCATHVYVAHFIEQQQQFLRQTFWPPAFNPYNLNANLQEQEQRSNKLTSLQAEHGHLSAECIGTKMSSSKGTGFNTKIESRLVGSSSAAHVVSIGAGTKKGYGDSKSMTAHTQLKQNTKQFNGSGTVSMPLNGSPAQSASVFNKSLYSAHALSQNLAQQSHFVKGQQVYPSSLHVGLSHSHSTQPQAHLQQQVQCEPLKQQRPCSTTSPQLYGAGSGALGNRLGFR